MSGESSALAGPCLRRMTNRVYPSAGMSSGL